MSAALNATIDRITPRLLKKGPLNTRNRQRKRGNGYRWPHFRTLARLYHYKQQFWRTP